MSAIEELVSYTLGLRYEDLPYEVVKVVKKSVLDTLSAIMAGSSSESPEKVISLVREWGGSAEGTIFVYGDKLPLPNAAWANSAMVRGFDFDEVHMPGAGHTSATVVPSALAISEYSQAFKSKPINGRDLIVAIALGNDLSCRLRLAGDIDLKWLAEPFTILAVAAVGGKLLDFNNEKIHNALGIAYFQCFGNLGASIGKGGGMMAIVGQGLSAKAGVLSVLLADRGITAQKEIIDGNLGIYAVYGNGEYNSELLVGDLGKRFESAKSTIKPYPGCGFTQTTIYGTIELAKEHNIREEDVAKVILRVSEFAYSVCGDKKGKPASKADALWNYPYTTAVALIKGNVTVDDFTDEAIGDPRVLELLQKVTVEIVPDQSLNSSSQIEIVTNDNRSYRKAVDYHKGHYLNPISWDELTEKFRSCNHFSAKPFPRENVESLIQMVEKLEEVENVTKIVSLLS
ncbi:MmgE/PrpD family protein [Thermodesulfobacteriota bacterium]